ncbi:MAG: ribosome assembly factor SBDS [Candidatus Diapherotrites archaeon]|uniref:Ribosome assembly factor SBDS n=1 Tax=Candidatus Iainarchaeum sp. TaxID=3101447 RepID=A0A8T4L5M1_9ARCH|nr:ribosome assembly factor SBDS [Candidatus Diapherotrites archaeon]
MVRVEDAVVARLEHAGLKFELLVDPDLALALKKGKPVSINDLVAIDAVFKDAKKGEAQSDGNIKSVFQTTNFEDIAKRIVLDGEVHLTTDQRRHLIEERRKEIVTFLAQNCIDPQHKTPHPPQRIENALNEIRFTPDLFKSTNQQAQEALKEIRKILPISMENVSMAVKIPSEYAARASAALFRHEVKRQEWQSDGSLIAILEMPVGLQQAVVAELNHLAKGSIESKMLK